MDREGLGGRYGRPLGKHHAAKQDPDWQENLLPKWEEAVRRGPDPGATRDEGLNEVDPGPADRPAFHDLLADDALNMDRRVSDAHVRTSKFGSPRPARLSKVKWSRVGEAFLRGFGMALGIVLGACAGVIIAGVLVMLLLTAFGAGQ